MEATAKLFECMRVLVRQLFFYQYLCLYEYRVHQAHEHQEAGFFYKSQSV